MIIDEENYLAHYGIIRRSGRYPWGSSNNVATRSKTFLDYVAEMKSAGLTDKQIAEGVGWSTTDLRNAKTIARHQAKQADIIMARRLRDKGMSQTAIAERMFGSASKESNVRALLSSHAQEQTDILTTTATMLRDQVAEKGWIDVGKGVEHHIGVTYDKLKAALAMLIEEGYVVHPVEIRQQGTGKMTRMKVLAPKGTTQKEIWMNQGNIKQIASFTKDSGRTWFGIYPPKSIAPKRVAVNYREDDGHKADGVIYVRPGVKDVSLGGANYAQVRIQVGKDHFLKGMAMYKDDLPEGIDLVFNTNKSKNDVDSDLDAMKPLARDPKDPSKVDSDNPFGAVIKNGGQQVVVAKDGTPKVTSVMNIVNEEGDWLTWSKTLSSQMLSKQSPRLAKAQLAVTREQEETKLKEIEELTNPTIKRKLLMTFADGADASAVSLKAAALNQRQSYHVILPVDSLPTTQIYAPNYQNGETVVLIRHPHGGTFEIPELVVNNNHKESKKLLGQARDAVGINAEVAERLSGADFDGDAVIVIPNDGDKKVSITAALEGLKDFDPKISYPGYEGMPKIHTQLQMGDISNLITDMTLKNATPRELAQAVRHSMVVIDAEKHNLNYRQSAIDNGIAKLKTKYQGGPRKGASTLISRASATKFVNDRIERRASEGGPIDPETGRKVYTETERMRTTRDGREIPKQNRSKRLAEVDDAYELIDGTGTPMERIYADHSNELKSIANRARLSALNTEPLPYNPSAAKAYKREVDSLVSKLHIAERNKPLERAAQVIAGAQVRARVQDNPSMDEELKRKIKFQALTEARNRTGAGKERIVIEPEEWDAIQAGAVSPTRLSNILDNADLDRVRELATPRRERRAVTSTMLARAQAMMAGGATRAEVARQLGIPLGTLDDALYS